MGSIKRFNKAKLFDVDLDGKETVKLAELEQGAFFPVDAIMFTEKGRFGKSAFIVSGDKIVYLPKHKVKECEEILCDEEIVEAIKRGKIGFTPYSYDDETGAERFSVNWDEK